MAQRSARERALEAENAELRALVGTLRLAVDTLTATLATHEQAFRDQKATLDKVAFEFETLKGKLFRRKSEKLPPPEGAKTPGPTPEMTQAKRRERAARRSAVPVETKPVPVAEDRRTCPHCGETHLKPVGGGRVVSLLDYTPASFIRREYVLETLACPCGEYIVGAESPVRPFEQGKYGPNFIAYVIVSKLLDATPHHRLQKMFERVGIPMSRSTMTDLLHRAAEMLAPLVTRLFTLIAAGEVVQADETSIKVQHREKLAYFWTFIHENLIGYRFSPNRSGDTPKQVLGQSRGVLVVDAYTGYNGVVAPDLRIRAACWAHVRRKLFEAREQAPAAMAGLDLIGELYQVERTAKERGVAGTPAHRKLRQAQSAPVLLKLKTWFEEQTGLHPPKSPMGRAVRYALKNWGPLNVFLDDPRVPVDNNRSESALRAIALGRKNFLFAGNDEAGANLAGLLSLLATCVANEVNPLDYLADVLIRIHTHPDAGLDDLLPHRWQPAA